MANPLVTGIISITLGVIMLANVFVPVVKGVNTDGWTSGENALIKSKVKTFFKSFGQ